MNTGEKSLDIRKECPDKGEECWVSPKGLIYTKKGIYKLNSSGKLVLIERKSYKMLAEVEIDLVKTLGKESLRNPDITLEHEGYIEYWETPIESKWILHNRRMTPFNVPTKEQIAAALARTGDKIGD